MDPVVNTGPGFGLYLSSVAETRLFFRIFLLLGVFTLTVAGQASKISTRNFLRINSEICTSGQPSLEDLSRFKEEGIRAILNLRRPSEDPILAEEEKKARALGLRYFNIPVDSSNLQEEDADEFVRVVADEANRPILIHCGSANRVGGFWIIYRVLQDHWSFEEAEEEARRIGLRNPGLADFARKYIEHRRGGDTRNE